MGLRRGYCATTRSGDAGDCNAASGKGSTALRGLMEPKHAKLPAMAMLACHQFCRSCSA